MTSRPIPFIPTLSPWTGTSTFPSPWIKTEASAISHCCFCYEPFQELQVELKPCGHQNFCVQCIRDVVLPDATRTICRVCCQQITQIDYNPLVEWKTFIDRVEEQFERLVWYDFSMKLSGNSDSPDRVICKDVRILFGTVMDKLREPRTLTNINEERAASIDSLMQSIKVSIDADTSYHEKIIMIEYYMKEVDKELRNCRGY